jgi:hypothetical protein
MTLPRSTLTLLAITGLAATALCAAPTPPAAGVPAPAPARVRTSPHETVGAKIDGNRVTITYGRPYSKDPKTGALRPIWGGLVPYGKIWRTGADEATVLLTPQPIELGGQLLPAGAYTLFTLPAADGSALLLVNRQVGQWGLDPYDEKQEAARIPLQRDTLAAPLDQFTIAIEKNPAGGGLLKLAWESTQYSAPFTVRK